MIKWQSPNDTRGYRRPNEKGEREVKPQTTRKISKLYIYLYIVQSCYKAVWNSEETSSLTGKSNSFLRLKSSLCILLNHFKIKKTFSEEQQKTQSWAPVCSWQDTAWMAGSIYNNCIHKHHYFCWIQFPDFSSQDHISLQSEIPASRRLQAA